MNCVELDTLKGVANPVLDLLSKTKVTVCGSPTCVGLYQLTLLPDLISTCCGENVVNGAVPFPPPACTLTILLFVAFEATALASIVIVVGIEVFAIATSAITAAITVNPNVFLLFTI